MIVLVDSNILINVTRGREEETLRWLDLARSGAKVICSAVTVAELWHSARPREEPALEALFRSISTVPVDEQIGRRAGEFLRRYHSSHQIGLADAIIAATASLQNAPLWTRNRKHFPMPEISFA